MRLLAAVVLVGALGCDAGSHLLVVDVRTDLTPLVEVDAFEVVLDEGAPVLVPVPEGVDLIAGARLAELAGVSSGAHVVRVRARRGDALVVERALAVELRADRAVTAVLARDCVEVDCSGDAELTCLAGTCVDRACTPETPERCPAPQCADALGCAPRAPCAAASCVAGACLYPARPFACGDGLACDPDAGCCDPTSGECVDPAVFYGRWAVGASADAIFLALDVAGRASLAGEELGSGTEISDLYLQARDAEGGTVRWTRRYATDYFEWPNDLAVLGDRVVLGGVAKGSELFAEAGITLAVEDHDGLVAVLDGADGAPVWALGASVEEGDADVLSVAARADGWIFALVRFAAPLTVGTLPVPAPAGEGGHAVIGFAPLPGGDTDWTPAWAVPVGGVPEQLGASDAGAWVVGGAAGMIAVGSLSIGAGDEDAFAALIDPATGTAAWLRAYGGAGALARASDVAIDASGRAHLIGSVSGERATFGSFERAPRGTDVLLLGLDATGEPLYAELAGGDGEDHGARITFSTASDALTWAATTSAPFEYAGIAVGDPANDASIVIGTHDTSGAPCGADTLAPGAAAMPWSAPWSLAVTASLRGCMVGVAPRDYAPAFFRGTYDSVYFSCGE